MPHPDEPEHDLVQRANSGDADAFGELIARHHLSALRIATVVLGTATGADDAVQDAAVRAWRARSTIDADRNFKSWYLTVVTNTTRNSKRALRRRAALELRETRKEVAYLSGAQPEDTAIESSERRAVVRALNQMTTNDRTVLALRYFEHLSEQETAAVLGCRVGTVKSRQARAMDRLRAQLASDSELRPSTKELDGL